MGLEANSILTAVRAFREETLKTPNDDSTQLRHRITHMVHGGIRTLVGNSDVEGIVTDIKYNESKRTGRPEIFLKIATGETVSFDKATFASPEFEEDRATLVQKASTAAANKGWELAKLVA